jgi:hypothetical protein
VPPSAGTSTINSYPEKTETPNENKKPTPHLAEQQKAARHPHEAPYLSGPFKKKKLAEHEAARTVVADEVGCTVLWTNISARNGRYRETQVNQPQTLSCQGPAD